MKRKLLDASKNKELLRKENTRKQGIRRLIVAEGETEIYYFDEIRKKCRLPKTIATVIHSTKGTSPEKIVESAIDLFLNGQNESHQSKVEARAYDEVYVVFDRDEHHHYKAALNLVRQNNKKHKNDDEELVKFIAIPSNPCFEYWLLLHFNDCRVLKHRDEVYRLLKKSFPKYDKASNTNFALTKHNLKDAMGRAESINKNSSPTNEENPYTDIPRLLRSLVPLEDLE